MHRIISRLIPISLLAAVLALAFGGQPPAALAGSSVYVNTGADESSACAAAPFSSIQDAINDPAGYSQIVICPGNYDEWLTISGRSGLKLVGMTGNPDDVLIRPPLPLFPGHDGGTLLIIEDSQKITLEGLRFDGAGRFAASTSAMYGLAINNSSVKIDTLHVTAIQNFPVDGKIGYGIYVADVYPDAMSKVSIQDTVIDSVSSYGIFLYGYGLQAKLKNNTISLPDAYQQVGIRAIGVDKLQIKGSTITSSDPNYDTGIDLQNMSGVKVSGNTITGTDVGISLTCSGTYLFFGSSQHECIGNKISKNTLTDVDSAGIYFSAMGGAARDYDAVASGNKVTGNTIVNPGGYDGIRFDRFDDNGAAATNTTMDNNRVTDNVIEGYTNPCVVEGTNSSVSGNTDITNAPIVCVTSVGP